MRFVLLSLLCLALFTLGSFSFGELGDTSEAAPVHLSPVSDTLWGEQLATFRKLLNTDADAARAELRNVAKILFGEHRLAEEWVPLYFRICQNGTEHPSDVKRVSELEIRMLTEIDSKKYSDQIHRHQEAFQRFAEMEKALHHHSHAPKTDAEKSVSTSEDEAERAVRKHAAAFEALRDKDAEAARAELAAIIALAYGEHPLIEKIADTIFLLSGKEKVTYPEVIELTELQLQVMKDSDAQKHAERIQTAEGSLKKLKNIANLLRSQGNLETESIPFHFKIDSLLPEKE